MEQKIDIPHKSDVSHLIALRKQLAIKSILTKEERKTLDSLNVTISFTESQYFDWVITQNTFGEMCFLAFQMAVKLVTQGYRLRDPGLVTAFHNAFELHSYQKKCFDRLESIGVDIYGEFTFYSSYNKKTKKDLFNALPNDVQAELLKQGLKV